MASLRSALAISAFAVAITAAATSPAFAYTTVSPQPACHVTTAYQDVNLSSLPSQATDTYNLIESDGPFPYSQDGVVFRNSESELPSCASGYYHEYTVITPGASTRGTRRIIVGGSDQEFFYTNDHYASFALVDVSA
jgi:ribonuclease T1